MKNPGWKVISSYVGVLVVGLLLGSQLPALNRRIQIYLDIHQIQHQVGEEPKNPVNWVSLGVLYGDLGDRENEEASYKKALEFDSSDAFALEGLGYLSYRFHDLNAAESWFTAALQAAQKKSEEVNICQAEIGLNEIRSERQKSKKAPN